MPHCFVMQPFDGGDFDHRYEDVFAPAIKAGGLEPYRVDQDPSVSIPIQDIEKGIRDSRLCLADISTDNPNVWFELGYAIATGKDVVLVCSEQRTTRFPFDVQHRTIIKYQTGSPRDFDALKLKITTKIEAFLQKEEALHTASAPSILKQIHGLDQNEIVALAAIGENILSPNDSVLAYQLKKDMEKAGFTNLATSMALHTLLKRGLISVDTGVDYDGDEYHIYSYTATGWDWMLENKQLFELRIKPKSTPAPKSTLDFDSFDSDIPF
ncbi:hypothetical protein [Pseudomonas fluorescens]|uniref:Uncharacterized protein n=1 Tax=Pseudomonas fluorescens TaxID=294 RepID=A0A5E7NAM9_PSEFL|nr:hypothetical protein [Pseudomonas fluorescens]VVP34238.1 hypothetical protein PS854_04476 [Pseudomonas fluorescens]